MWVGSIVGIALRFFLYFAGVSEMLEEHLELNSPMTSHIRLKEGLFLLDGGISPYAGDSCHHPPLLLLMLQQIGRISETAHFTFLVAVDLAVALLLRQLAVAYRGARQRAGRPWAEASVRLVESKDAKKESAAKVAEDIEEVISPAFVGLFYLLNPLTVLSCVALSLQNIQHLAFVGAICAASAGKGGLSAVAVAWAFYVCPYTPLVLLVPCASLAFYQRAARCQAAAAEEEDFRYARSCDEKTVDFGFVLYCVGFTIASLGLFACLLGASAAAMDGQFQFLEASFLSVLRLRDLTPNTGLFWYIFIEIFDRYYALFVFAFHGQILLYSIPLHLRLGSYRPTGPFIHCGAALGIISLFKPYPTACDYALMLSAMLVQSELIRESEKYFAFLLSGMLFGLCMFPTMDAVWLGRNAGNANYLYNMTLVVNVFGCLTLTEWVKAGMRLRHRQHHLAYCRQLVFQIVDEVSSDPAAAKASNETAVE